MTYTRQALDDSLGIKICDNFVQYCKKKKKKKKKKKCTCNSAGHRFSKSELFTDMYKKNISSGWYGAMEESICDAATKRIELLLFSLFLFPPHRLYQ